MKIFVTGGSGFIGSNFIKLHLEESQNEILNYDAQTYAGKGNNLSKYKENDNYRFIEGNICDRKSLYKAISMFKPDIIVHFAAESHVDRSIDDPLCFVNTNILGTYHLLEICRELLDNKLLIHESFKFIHISTDEVFGSLKNDGKFNEKSNYRPNSPYSASKSSSDHLVRAWSKTYGIPSVISNCSNNYGPFQYPEKLIPLLIVNCVDEKPLPIYGSGNNIRDWLFVEDHCKAINNIIDKGVPGQNYVIGGNNELKNIEIASKICTLMDGLRPRKNNLKHSDLIVFVEDRPGHDFRYAIDATKINNDLLWKPIESFETGILKTINWYLKNESWWREIQLAHYQQERLGLKE